MHFFCFKYVTVNVVILVAPFSLTLVPPFKGLWSSDTKQGVQKLQLFQGPD